MCGHVSQDELIKAPHIHSRDESNVRHMTQARPIRDIILVFFFLMGLTVNSVMETNN